jgi:hypothetical protein
MKEIEMRQLQVGTRVRVVKASASTHTLTGTVVSRRVYRVLPIEGQEPVKWPGYLVFLDRDIYNFKLAGMTKETQPEFRRFVNLDRGVSVLFVHAENLEVV